jgi:hypothetical protein
VLGHRFGHSHTIHFRAFRQEIFALPTAMAKCLSVKAAANRGLVLLTIYDAHWRGSGEELRCGGVEPRTKRVSIVSEGAGNARGNLLQALR